METVNKIDSIANIRKIVFGGNSTFTIKNVHTGKHFTFKVNTLKDTAKKGEVWFVNVLTGPDNNFDYSYMGMVNKDRSRFFRTKKSKISDDAPSFVGFAWFFKMLKTGMEFPEYVHFYHSGRCARCGRKLTTPESIKAGFGPECITKI